MYYAKSLRGTSSDNKTREWRLCVRHEDEKRRILQSCHESQTGELLNYEAYLPFVHVVYVNDSVLFVYVSDAGAGADLGLNFWGGTDDVGGVISGCGQLSLPDLFLRSQNFEG